MGPGNRLGGALAAAFIAAVPLSVGKVHAQTSPDPNAAPNPYRVMEDWAKLPGGRKLGQSISVDIDPDGKSVRAFERCGDDKCTGASVAPILKFDAAGNLLKSF